MNNGFIWSRVLCFREMPCAKIVSSGHLRRRSTKPSQMLSSSVLEIGWVWGPLVAKVRITCVCVHIIELNLFAIIELNSDDPNFNINVYEEISATRYYFVFTYYLPFCIILYVCTVLCCHMPIWALTYSNKPWNLETLLKYLQSLHPLDNLLLKLLSYMYLCC